MCANQNHVLIFKSQNSTVVSLITWKTYFFT